MEIDAKQHVIIANFPLSVLRQMFLGKPGDTYTINLTPEFQEILEKHLGDTPRLVTIEYLWKSHEPAVMEARFHVEEFKED